MKPRALLLGGLILAATAPAASAATKPVYMGTPPAAQKTFQGLNGDANDYFPHAITIHAGDSVQFIPVGFHTVDIPAKGGGPVALIAAQGNDMVTGVNDAAGNPFWFNGQVPNFGFNPVLLSMLYGKSATYTGSKSVETGLPLAPKPKPVEVTFPKTGTYTYYCDVHPGMTGKVHVVAKKAKAPSKKADAKVVKNQIARDIKELKRVNQFKPASGTIQIGGAGKHGVESYSFFPANPTVKVGSTINFAMPVGTTEVHTATTGPGDPEKDSTYLGALAASFESPTIDPRAINPSDAPGNTPPSLTPALHGNGFWNSGALDRDKNSPLPPLNRVTFGAAGTYTFYCLIHPFMKAVVTAK